MKLAKEDKSKENKKDLLPLSLKSSILKNLKSILGFFKGEEKLTNRNYTGFVFSGQTTKAAAVGCQTAFTAVYFCVHSIFSHGICREGYRLWELLSAKTMRKSVKKVFKSIEKN